MFNVDLLDPQIIKLPRFKYAYFFKLLSWIVLYNVCIELLF